MKEIEQEIINKYLLIENIEKQKYDIQSCMMDGIIFPEDFVKSNFKIGFILKEPYTEWDEENDRPKNCNQSFTDIADNLEYEVQKGLNNTWKKVAAMSYALKYKKAYTEDLSYTEIRDGLACVYWINVSKTPWKSQTQEDKAFKERGNLWRPLVDLQLKHFSSFCPNIILYGKMWDYSIVNPFEKDIPWNSSFQTNLQKFPGASEKSFIEICKYRNTNQIIVNGYHPLFWAEQQVSYIQTYTKSNNIIW